MNTSRWMRGTALLLAAVAAPALSADAGRIVIGASAPLTGAAAESGTALAQGLRLGFAQVNAAGGIAGRAIELIVRDDAGDAARAAANTRALMQQGALALTGYHGAAAAEAALPLLEPEGVPMVGVASSAETLREPLRPLLFNLRAGAREEAAAIVTQIDAVGLTDIAAVTQDDALGQAGRDGIRIELARLAMGPVVQAQIGVHASDAELQRAVNVVCKTPPQALVLVLNARNALAVIRLVRVRGCVRQIYLMSETGAQLVAEAKEPAELAGLVVSQVLPSPTAMGLPVLIDYARQIAAAQAKPSYPGLEGYLYARLIAEALARCAREPSRRCLIAALESRPLEVGGYRVTFSPSDHRGSRFVEMTIVTSDGRFRR
jgi:ABC-type branched-subunit amino acid transport system substrate-binding protein